jgi:DNA-directed RNA polymerase specialized sigma24 family protein
MAGAADAASGPHHAPRFGGHESLIDLRRAFARLPDMQGRAFAMRKIGGLEYAEIAEALGTTEESARASVYVAAKKLGAAR